MQATVIWLIVFSGISFAFWGGIGLLRFATENLGDNGDSAAGQSVSKRDKGAIVLGAVFGIVSVLAFWLVLILAKLMAILLNGSMPAIQLLAGTGIFLLAAWLMLGYWGAWMVSGKLANHPDAITQAMLTQAVVHALGVLTIVFPAALAAGFDPTAIGGGVCLLFALAFAAAALGTRCPDEYLQRRPGEITLDTEPLITIDKVAVVIPAHNEERVLPHCIGALKRVLPMTNVFVGDDGSTDQTASIAEEAGCQVVTMRLNKGKAFTIQYILDHERICERYRAVMILDADSEIDAHYLERALPLLNRPGIAAVAGHVLSKWRHHLLPRWSMFFAAYRVRLYLVLQAVLRYGQTWGPTNVHYIVPGFASIYRTEALARIDVAAPGLIIEDFNMTFELHRKGLGKIAYSPSVRCISQDPAGLRDYIKQLKRWNLGFWQTVRRNGFWPSLFWLSLAVFILELLLFSAFLLTLPFQLLYFFFDQSVITAISLPLFDDGVLTLPDLIIGVMLIDYGLTIITAIIERKPVLLIYGIGFFLIRFIDAFLLLYACALSYFVRSDGRWVSPART